VAIPRIGKLSYGELIELQSRIDAMIDQRRAEEQAKVFEKAAELAAEAGFSLEEVVTSGRATRGGKRKGFKVAFKYRNPKDPSQTWTGRGRQPRWLVAELQKGKNLDAFRIQ
jgi:DNA-binding protein H-NS